MGSRRVSKSRRMEPRDKHEPVVLACIKPNMQEYLDIHSSFLRKFVNVNELNDKQKEALTKEYSLALISEVMELLREMNFKSWRPRTKTVNIDKVTEEAVDIFNFFLNLLLIWGIDGDDFAKKFFAKDFKIRERFKREYESLDDVSEEL